MAEMNETEAESADPTPPADLLGPVRRFRMLAVRYSLLVVGVAALIAYRFNPVIAQGILLGGLGGVLGFWMMARRIEKFATIPASQVKLEVYKGTFFRLILYALVLWKAYTLDPETMVGFLSAAGGILVIRVVTVVLGVTSIDLRTGKPRGGT